MKLGARNTLFRKPVLRIIKNRQQLRVTRIAKRALHFFFCTHTRVRTRVPRTQHELRCLEVLSACPNHSKSSCRAASQYCVDPPPHTARAVNDALSNYQVLIIELKGQKPVHGYSEYVLEYQWYSSTTRAVCYSSSLHSREYIIPVSKS